MRIPGHLQDRDSRHPAPKKWVETTNWLRQAAIGTTSVAESVGMIRATRRLPCQSQQQALDLCLRRRSLAVFADPRCMARGANGKPNEEGWMMMKTKVASAVRFAAACAVVSVATTAHAQEIRVLNWQGFGTDESWSLELFREATGIDVVHDYYTSDQEMLTKLRTNPGAYDVIMVNSAFTRQAADEGLIRPIDTSRIENLGDLTPELRENPNLVFDGETYGVAWVWGLTSFAVDVTDFPDLPDSIEALWSPETAGRVGWRDDAVEAVRFAAIATGQNINNPTDMGAIREKLRALKPQIRTLWSSENEWNQFLAADEFDIAIYWSGSALRSKQVHGLPIEFIVPVEGAIGWLDGLSIASESANPDAALKFIDWMIDPDFYVPWDTNVGAPASANAIANAALPLDSFNRAVLGDPAKMANVQIMGPIDDGMREQFLELWQETKAYFQE